MRRLCPILCALAVALLLPAGALAQGGAGDDQYTDPFASGQATPTPTPRAPAPAPTAAPPASTGAAQPASAAAAPAPAAPAAAPAPTLARTGMDAWLTGALGAALLAAGIGLRVRLRAPR